MKVDIIGIQMDLGASMRGVNMGPLAIRQASILEGIRDLGLEVFDKGDIIPRLEPGVENIEENPKLKHRQIIVEANKKLYEEVKDSLKKGHMPIILGGDHSVAAGSIPAIEEIFGDIGIIWVDAHGDYNNDLTTGSGNMHGMPFSAVTGFGPDEMIPFTSVRVGPKKCVQIAARSVDKEERLQMKKSGITVFSIHDIDKIGMANVIDQAIKIAGDKIHLSFDLDAVTPEEAPGVGTPVHSGLSVRESFLIVEELYKSGRVKSCDMVEVNPILDIRNKTGKLAAELILALLGKTVF